MSEPSRFGNEPKVSAWTNRRQDKLKCHLNEFKWQRKENRD